MNRRVIHDKFGGRCAYTGKPLGDDWQIDHVVPKRHGISSVFGGQRLARHLLEIVGNRPAVTVIDDRTLLLAKREIL
jgi:5-methylcytosine-specific restriction endonuclease McrA